MTINLDKLHYKYSLKLRVGLTESKIELIK